MCCLYPLIADLFFVFGIKRTRFRSAPGSGFDGIDWELMIGDQNLQSAPKLLLQK